MDEFIPAFDDPIALFEQWFGEARTKETISDATAMTLATTGADGQPHARIVLMKGVSPEGFTFYTNLGSNKAQQLSENMRAALCFHWVSLDKQVRIEGDVVAVSDEEADAYFYMRPRESQIGAWASVQSTELDSRATLEERVSEFSKKYDGQEVPRPPFWSGFRVEPNRIEFWLHGLYRLHHRRVYERAGDNWSQKYLYP